MLPAIDANFYFDLKLENKNVHIEKIENDNKVAKNGKLIFNIDCFTNMQHFCIFSNIIIKVIAIMHKNGYLNFAKYYKILARL